MQNRVGMVSISCPTCIIRPGLSPAPHPRTRPGPAATHITQRMPCSQAGSLQDITNDTPAGEHHMQEDLLVRHGILMHLARHQQFVPYAVQDTHG